MRKVVLALLLGLGSVVLVLMTAQWFMRRARPAVDGELRVAGLAAHVDVWRDSLGVPHIRASSERDLYFAQGYTHAQDRLWQLELLRRVAEGRLAEIMGEDLVESDRFLRTVGLWRAAAGQEHALDGATRSLLEAYAAGINAYIAKAGRKLPPEFLILRSRPEPWTVRHTLAIEKIMAWDLSMYNLAVAMHQAARSLGAERFRHLTTEYPEWGANIVESLESSQPAAPIPAAAAHLLESASIVRASNAWVIGGTRTASGRPILANDMHLALRAPSVWYLMALHADESSDADAAGISVAGMSLPGAPGIIAGHNRSVAWGFTNAMLDDLDLFIERIDPADSTRYLVPGGSAAFETVEDSIRVRGRAAAEAFVIRSTRHGPVVRDDSAGTVIALRWAAHNPSTAFDAVRRFNRARSADEMRAAIPLFNNPHQNVVYADTTGEYGYMMAGRIPDRGGRPAPVLPVPGWTGDWDWRGYLPHAMHPAVANPPSGYVVTANNRQTPEPLSALIGNDWAPPYRAMRIVEMARGARSATADSVHAMQLDVQDLMALRYREHAAGSAESAGSAAMATRLRAWDARATPRSAEAAWFYVWYEAMRDQVAHDLYGRRGGYLPGTTLDQVLDRRALPWHDADASAAYDSIARRSARQADSLTVGKVWGDLHRIAIEHPLGSVASLNKAFRFNIGPTGRGGSPNTVNVSQFFVDAWPVTSTYAASQRHVVDLGNIDGAGGFILPSGQSGLPFDPDYRNQWPRWLAGGLWLIPLDQSRATERAVRHLRLVPAEAAATDTK